jgi:hypothetical protein
MSDIEYDLADVIIGKPHDFSVGRKHFRLYPVTLAKTFLLKRHIDELGIEKDILKANPYLEALRIAGTCREACCRILAIHTAPNTYKDLFDQRSMAVRRNYFAAGLSDEDLASLMIIVLASDKTDTFITHLGLDEDRRKISRIMEIKHKHDSNSVTFGGRSLFGSFIGQLKEMGYSDEEILYERPYSFLRLMLADKVVSIYMSDDEKGELPPDLGGTFLDGNDPGSIKELNSYLASKGLKTI